MVLEGLEDGPVRCSYTCVTLETTGKTHETRWTKSRSSDPQEVYGVVWILDRDSQPSFLGTRPGTMGPDIEHRVLTVRSLDTRRKLISSSGVRVFLFSPLKVSKFTTRPWIRTEGGVTTRSSSHPIERWLGEMFPRGTGTSGLLSLLLF